MLVEAQLKREQRAAREVARNEYKQRKRLVKQRGRINLHDQRILIYWAKKGDISLDKVAKFVQRFVQTEDGLHDELLALKVVTA